MAWKYQAEVGDASGLDALLHYESMVDPNYDHVAAQAARDEAVRQMADAGDPPYRVSLSAVKVTVRGRNMPAAAEQTKAVPQAKETAEQSGRPSGLTVK